MRRQIGPRGGAARQDVLAAVDLGAISNDNGDYAAWVAHRQAKKKSEKIKVEESGAMVGENRRERVRTDTEW